MRMLNEPPGSVCCGWICVSGHCACLRCELLGVSEQEDNDPEGAQTHIATARQSPSPRCGSRATALATPYYC